MCFFNFFFYLCQCCVALEAWTVSLREPGADVPAPGANEFDSTSWKNKGRSTLSERERVGHSGRQSSVKKKKSEVCQSLKLHKHVSAGCVTLLTAGRSKNKKKTKNPKTTTTCELLNKLLVEFCLKARCKFIKSLVGNFDFLVKVHVYILLGCSVWLVYRNCH